MAICRRVRLNGSTSIFDEEDGVATEGDAGLLVGRPRPRRALKVLVRVVLPLALVAVAAGRYFARTLSESRLLGAQSKVEQGDAIVETRSESAAKLRNASAVIGVRGLVWNRQGLCLHTGRCCGQTPWMGPCDVATSQQWEFTSDGLLRHDFGGCLDRGGFVLHMWRCNASNPYQLWEYDPATGGLRGLHEPRRCLDIDGKRESGARATLAPCAPGNAGQRWSVALRIGALQLAANSCLLAQGGKVVLSGCQPGHASTWAFDASAGLLEHLASGLCAEVSHNDILGLRDCDRSSGWLYRPSSFQLVDGQGRCLHGLPHFEGGAQWSGGSRVMSSVCGGTKDQAWLVGVRVGEIQHGSGFCIDVGDKPSNDSSLSIPVVQRMCESGPIWSYHDATGTLRLPTDWCLEAFVHFRVGVLPCRSGAASQQWYVDDRARTISHNGLCLYTSEPRTPGSTVKLAWCDGEKDSPTTDYVLSKHGRTTPFIAIETRSKDKYLPMPGNTARTMVNYGVGQHWQGFRTKPLLYQAALQEMAKTDPHRIAVIIDTDMIDGGCSHQDLMDRYRSIVNASSGASVVASGDVNQYPPIPDGEAMFDKAFGTQRAQVMKAFGLTIDAVDAYKQHRKATSYKFVNSGFLMGPVGALKETITCMLDMGLDQECLKNPECPREQKGSGQECCFDDQLGLTKCALKSPDKITVDYTGSLIQTTFGMNNMFELRHGQLENIVTKGTQCFVHVNGEDQWQDTKWDTWAAQIKNQLAAERGGP